MTTVEILKAAKQVISKPEQWCQGAEAMTADGKEVEATDAKAVKFCMLGSVNKTVRIGSLRLRALTFLQQTLQEPEIFIGDWNDEWARTHAEVMAKFDEAIALAEAAQC